jgi:hypothetical protein
MTIYSEREQALLSHERQTETETDSLLKTETRQ